jgi:lambda family phage tail tape measure protein
MEERSRLIEEARQQQEDLKNTIESSMGDAFMSIVDGTKTVEDAFRDMARQIIAELYRVLVVKKMVSAITGAFGFADGGAFQGGSQIQAYANGGIVGSPTYFPMAGGKTGLMGEAGPEAIMPLKRGKNGKLGVQVDGGQQQSVVVNQSFNFAANGDESVKRIIAQQAPKIAQMTQQQIMDSRRRGGQMKAVFG